MIGTGGAARRGADAHVTWSAERSGAGNHRIGEKDAAVGGGDARRWQRSRYPPPRGAPRGEERGLDAAAAESAAAAAWRWRPISVAEAVKLAMAMAMVVPMDGWRLGGGAGGQEQLRINH